MAIQRSNDADGTTLIFVLPSDDPDGPVSVVGSFNDWTPGAHPLQADSDGSRSSTVVVTTGEDVYFRYLGPDGHWFDDPEADEITANGSVLRARADEIADEAPAVDQAAPEPATEAGEPISEAGEPVSEHSEAEVPDETGERLEAVAERIDVAKRAARDLVDHDAIEPSATDVFENEKAQEMRA